MLRVLPVALAHLCFLSLLPAQTTIYVVRHADRAPGNEDPPISETGRLRAKALARLLTDAPLGAIFATEAVRTQQTAAPTAEAHHLSTGIH
ncbi:MAG: histidine phosphatase family protein [Paludibaculum sp.]